MNTTAVIGDVGGHVDQLQDCLARLGVTGHGWPAGLHVVQVGDLFGGNADVDVAHLVQPHLYAGRWTQLVGNWELAAVGGPAVTDRNGSGADPEALTMFARWHGAGLVRYATTITSTSGRTALVTHAGVTHSWLERNVHGPHGDPTVVATTINNLDPDRLHYGGEMFHESRTRPGAVPSPVWASTRELWRSWATVASPWPQVHGHTSSRDWRRRRWHDWVPGDLVGNAHPSPTLRHVRYQPDQQPHPIWGIDPGLNSRTPPRSLHPLILHTPSVDAID